MKQLAVISFTLFTAAARQRQSHSNRWMHGSFYNMPGTPVHVNMQIGRLECPASFVPVEMRQTGMEGAMYCARQGSIGVERLLGPVF